jgi:benzoylsuccinyl-CoA thiolase BbsB subunit
MGAAMTRIGRYPEMSFQNLGWGPVKQAIEEAGLTRDDIQAVYCGSAYGGRLAGQRVLRPLGMTGIPIVNCENACSSGATAFREAYFAVAHGIYDRVLVIGIDKLSMLGGGVLPGQPEDWEVEVGLTMPALYAMRARRYMHEYGVTREQLSKVSVKARAYGAINPYAQYQKPVTIDEVMNARLVAEPFSLLHCCPTGDGAAALVLCAKPVVKGSKKPVWVAATELTSGRYVTGFREMTVAEITARGAKELYEETGIGPQDIDVAEVHDAFAIAELMYYEALGFCQRGEAISLLESGATSKGGRIPVNPSGGLLSKGHPVGATGAAQLVEIVWHLRGEAGARQADGAKTGMAHCTGGGIAGLDHGACAITILKV